MSAVLTVQPAVGAGSATSFEAIKAALEAEGITYGVEEEVIRHVVRMVAEQGEAVTSAAAALEALCLTTEANAINKALDHLNKVSEPLAEIVLNRLVTNSVTGKRVDEVEVS